MGDGTEVLERMSLFSQGKSFSWTRANDAEGSGREFGRLFSALGGDYFASGVDGASSCELVDFCCVLTERTDEESVGGRRLRWRAASFK